MMNLLLLVSSSAILFMSCSLATEANVVYPPTTHTNLRHHAAVRNLGLTTTGLSAEEFVNQCTTHLLSDDTVTGDLISQEEFAQFLSNLCIEQQVCEEGTVLDFDNLSVELQLAFVSFLCNEPTESEREDCLNALKESGISFGYDVNDEEDVEVLESEIQQLCADAYLYAMRSGILPLTMGTYCAVFSMVR